MRKIKQIALRLALEAFEPDEEVGKITATSQSFYSIENSQFEVESDGSTWMVLTEEEKEIALKDYISDSVWAFATWFLWAFNPTAFKKVFGTEEELERQQTRRCEDANEIILDCINDSPYVSIDDFIKKAVKLDGAVHFLNRYDCETELEVTNRDILSTGFVRPNSPEKTWCENQKILYCYRTN